MDFNYQLYLQSDMTYIYNCGLEVPNVIMSFEREMMTSPVKPAIYLIDLDKATLARPQGGQNISRP